MDLTRYTDRELSRVIMNMESHYLAVTALMEEFKADELHNEVAEYLSNVGMEYTAAQWRDLCEYLDDE